jgi:voltage-gated potassium channel
LGVGKQYMTSFYFVVVTMTTVGYGDILPHTIYEQFYVVLLMMGGVFVFSLVTGSLASILAQMDTSNAALNEKILFLNRLRG